MNESWKMGKAERRQLGGIVERLEKQVGTFDIVDVRLLWTLVVSQQAQIGLMMPVVEGAMQYLHSRGFSADHQALLKTTRTYEETMALS